MQKIVILNTHRSDYDIRDAADSSITVRELIEELRGYDEDLKVVFSNDHGYTYGYISEDDVDYINQETREEEAERERMEEEEAEREEEEETMETIQGHLTDIQSRYENPTEDGHMTDEEYREEREDIFRSYGITEEMYNQWLNK